MSNLRVIIRKGNGEVVKWDIPESIYKAMEELFDCVGYRDPELPSPPFDPKATFESMREPSLLYRIKKNVIASFLPGSR